MTTFYVDPVNGNDNYPGTSPTIAWTSTASHDGAGYITDMNANFTPSYVGQYFSCVYGMYKITGIDSPTNIYIGVISTALPPVISGMIYYIGGKTKTLSTATSAGHAVAGDTIKIAKTPNPVNTDIDSLWTDGSNAVKLSGQGIIYPLSNCDTSWSSTAYGTASLNGSYKKEGLYSANIVISSSAVINVKLAYTAISSCNLSSFRQLSFWIRGSTTISANKLAIALCSDNAGAVPLATINIPAITLSGYWLPITIDYGGNLPDGVNSIALYSTSNWTTLSCTILLDNIVACLAPSAAKCLTHSMFISKNKSNEGFFSISSLTHSGSDTIVTLDYSPNSSSVARGYFGDTETVKLLKRETYRVSTTSELVLNSSGTATDLIYIEGGWNTSDWNTQDGETWFDGVMIAQSTTGLGLSRNYLSINKCSFVKFNYGIYCTTATNIVLKNISCCANGSYGLYFSSSSVSIKYIENLYITCNSSYGLYMTSSAKIGYFKNIYSAGNSNTGIYCSGSFGVNGENIRSGNNNGAGIYFIQANGGTINNITVGRNNTSGFQTGSQNMIINNLLSYNNGTYGLDFSSTYGSNNRFKNVTCYGNGTATIYQSVGVQFIDGLNSSDPIVLVPVTSTSVPNSCVYITNFNKQNRNCKFFTEGGLISTNALIKHSPHDVSWLMDVTSTSRDEYMPLKFTVAKAKIKANNANIAIVWVKRATTDRNFVVRFIIEEDDLIGIPNDIYTDALNTTEWQPLTLKFSTTSDAYVSFAVEAWGAVDSVYVDDFRIS